MKDEMRYDDLVGRSLRELPACRIPEGLETGLMLRLEGCVRRRNRRANLWMATWITMLVIFMVLATMFILYMTVDNIEEVFVNLDALFVDFFHSMASLLRTVAASDSFAIICVAVAILMCILLFSHKSRLTDTGR